MQCRVKTVAMPYLGAEDYEPSLIPKPFANRESSIMKPPPTLVKDTTNNARGNITVSRIFGETTASFMGRKKKVLFNKRNNALRTPGRNIPLVIILFLYLLILRGLSICVAAAVLYH